MSYLNYKMRKPLSGLQITCLILLWVVLCYYVLMHIERIDGPIILSVIISGLLVFIPLYKSLKKRK